MWRDRKWQTNIHYKKMNQLGASVNKTCLCFPLGNPCTAICSQVYSPVFSSMLCACCLISPPPPPPPTPPFPLFCNTRWTLTHHLHRLLILGCSTSFFFFFSLTKGKRTRARRVKLFLFHTIFTHYLMTVSNYRETRRVII